MKTAIILGATGLVGSKLLPLLLNDDRFDCVRSFGRRTCGIIHSKLKEYIIDFEKPAEWKSEVKGDVLFSTFGTTLAQAGNKQNQYKIDVTYQLTMAEAAAGNGVSDYVLVSTPGASEKSMIYYTRIRGELDKQVKGLGFNRMMFIKPSVLVGKREKIRNGERFAIAIGSVLFKIPGLRKYRPVKAEIVARAMIEGYFSQSEPFEEMVLGKVFEKGLEP